jgi:hypothetical protein
MRQKPTAAPGAGFEFNKIFKKSEVLRAEKLPQR